MAKRHVLIAGFPEASSQVEALLPKVSGQLELVAVPDGARCITAHTKLAAAGLPPLVVILRDDLEFVDGPQVAQAIRATERGLGVAASAILYASMEGASTHVEGLVAQVGRAVNFNWPSQQTPEQAAQRLVKATAKILEQLRKRGKS